MKKLFVFIFIIISTVGFAQSKSPSVECELCNINDFTSITQLKDVEETDSFYVHLQSLVERYGVNVAACNKTTFNGNQILTNASLLQMLSSSLTRINELREVVIMDKTETERKKISEKIKLYSFDFFNHKYKTVSQIKDIKALNCYYQAAQILLEDYNVDITNKAGLMQANKPANGKNIGTLLKQVFGLSYFDVLKYSKAEITKAEFAILLNEALDQYNEKIADAAYN
jgi:hypothetical protein